MPLTPFDALHRVRGFQRFEFREFILTTACVYFIPSCFFSCVRCTAHCHQQYVCANLANRARHTVIVIVIVIAKRREIPGRCERHRGCLDVPPIDEIRALVSGPGDLGEGHQVSSRRQPLGGSVSEVSIFFHSGRARLRMTSSFPPVTRARH